MGTRSYHQCRQRYLLMRRKEAAARANGDDGDGGAGLSASASDSNRRSRTTVRIPTRPVPAVEGRVDRTPSYLRGDSYAAEGATSTPLHKLSIGARLHPEVSTANSRRPIDRMGLCFFADPTHNRMMSHPHAAGPLSPSMQPTSPFSSQTPSAVRRGHYPPPSPLSTSRDSCRRFNRRHRASCYKDRRRARIRVEEAIEGSSRAKAGAGGCTARAYHAELDRGQEDGCCAVQLMLSTVVSPLSRHVYRTFIVNRMELQLLTLP